MFVCGHSANILLRPAFCKIREKYPRGFKYKSKSSQFIDQLGALKGQQDGCTIMYKQTIGPIYSIFIFKRIQRYWTGPKKRQRWTVMPLNTWVADSLYPVYEYMYNNEVKQINIQGYSFFQNLVQNNNIYITICTYLSRIHINNHIFFCYFVQIYTKGCYKL